MNILVLNVGSSSVKFQLVRTTDEQLSTDTDERLARGLVERLGGAAIYTLSAEGRAPLGAAHLRDHRAAVDFILQWLTSEESGVPIRSVAEIDAAGPSRGARRRAPDPLHRHRRCGARRD